MSWMNIFFLLLQPLFAWRHRKETCCFFHFFLFHMFMNWRWSNCFARARCSDTIWTEKFRLWTVEGLWHKGIWCDICVTIVASKRETKLCQVNWIHVRQYLLGKCGIFDECYKKNVKAFWRVLEHSFWKGRGCGGFQNAKILRHF